MRYLFVILSLLFMVELAATESTLVSLRGYLGKEQLDESRKVVAAHTVSSDQVVIIQINSTSGDLLQMLDFAKFLYEHRNLHHNKIVIYIEDSAIGPAAILPFLADQLYISQLVSWGDIPLGNEKTVPTNLLRNRVMSLIDVASSKIQILRVLAIAMCDSDVKVVDEQGWKIVPGDQTTYSPVISEKGETLVVNQHQLKDLGLVTESLTIQEFKKKFALEKAESHQAQLSEGLKVFKSLQRS